MKCESCGTLGDAYGQAAHDYLKRVSRFNDCVEAPDSDVAAYQARKRDMDESGIDLRLAIAELERHRRMHAGSN